MRRVFYAVCRYFSVAILKIKFQARMSRAHFSASSTELLLRIGRKKYLFRLCIKKPCFSTSSLLFFVFVLSAAPPSLAPCLSPSLPLLLSRSLPPFHSHVRLNRQRNQIKMQIGSQRILNGRMRLLFHAGLSSNTFYKHYYVFGPAVFFCRSLLPGINAI